MPCDQLRVQLGNNSEPHWQGSSLRMMYLVRSASLRNIILRLRKLAPEAAILPVILNIQQPSSIGAFAGDGAAIATS